MGCTLLRCMCKTAIREPTLRHPHVAGVARDASNHSRLSGLCCLILVTGSHSQTGHCRATEAAEACLLDMRQLRGSACAAHELCFAGAHHDLGAASLQVRRQRS
jgi:hypothetical protein